MTTAFTLRQKLLRRILELSAAMEPEPTYTPPVLRKLPGIKAVAFDFYGTMFMSGTGDALIDEPKKEEAVAFEAAFETMFPDLAEQPDANEGVQVYKQVIHDHKAAMKADGVDYPEVQITEVWRDVISRLRGSGTDGLPENPDQELLEELTIEFEMRNNPTWPMPDLRSTLEALEGKSLKLGILSNSQFYTPMIYEAHIETEPDQAYFDINLCIWSYEERLCKPSLDFHKRLKTAFDAHYGIKPEEVLFVGNDMLKDIYPAHHFGFKTALFAGDQRSLKWRKDDARVSDITPDLTITRLYQLVQCL